MQKNLFTCFGRHINYKILMVAGLILCCPLILFALNKTDSIFTVLNSEIGKRTQYSNLKENKISAIRKEFKDAHTPRERFESCLELFNEYRCYQSDSAYHYALMLNEISLEDNNKEGIAMANMSLMDYYTSVGFFKEAYEIKDRLIKHDLPAKYLPVYYNLFNRYFQNMGGYVGGPHTVLGATYEKARLGVLDSLISVLNHNSGAYHIALLEREQIISPSAERAFKERLRILQRYELTNHEKAVQYSILGRLSLELGNPEDAKYYLALSAIHDIRGDIKETTAAKMLAELLFYESEFDESYNLIHMAFDDASFYNSHLRKDETSSIMRMIEVEHHNKLNNKVWEFGIVAGLIFLLLVWTLFLLSKIRKKKQEVENANCELKQKSDEIDSINKELKNVINQLKEVTEIKDAYIMQSLYMNTSFVNNVEEKCHNVVKLLKDKKYDAIKYLPYEMGIKEERARIYYSFDKAFLSLFPNFVDEFNQLFKPEDHPLESNAKELPVEVRIFALMRLGISDTQEVAKYLNLSVKTIYVYKTKIKSRSIVDNADFESRIMAIPKV